MLEIIATLVKSSEFGSFVLLCYYLSHLFCFRVGGLVLDTLFSPLPRGDFSFALSHSLIYELCIAIKRFRGNYCNFIWLELKISFIDIFCRSYGMDIAKYCINFIVRNLWPCVPKEICWRLVHAEAFDITFTVLVCNLLVLAFLDVFPNNRV